VQPKKGRIVLWPNVLDEDPTKQEERTWHEANPVKTGFKHSGTIWFHLREPDRQIEDGNYDEDDYDYDGIPGRLMPGEIRHMALRGHDADSSSDYEYDGTPGRPMPGEEGALKKHYGVKQ